MANYTLQSVHYTWKNALLWGNFFEHCKEVRKGNLCHRIVHSLIALTQVCPILSQISSIAEKLIVTYCLESSNHMLDPARITKEKPPVADKMPMPAPVDPRQSTPEVQTHVPTSQDSPNNQSNPSIHEKDIPAVEILADFPSKNFIPEPPPLIVQKQYFQGENENTRQYLTRIFEDTLKACKHGYQLADNKIVKINNEPMLRETVSYGQLDLLPPNEQPHQTEFNVMTQDTLQVLLKRKAEGGNPVGINMANRYKAGGGVDHGCTAQEEALCRSSNHILGLQTQQYPLELKGEFILRMSKFSVMIKSKDSHSWTNRKKWL
ncbi:MAG: DUF2263 domain-containing protein [Parachlamydiaceae bacterium]|nr:MAG: DUF2263 domain-containing protein [Parachlamydiaceae bacterium]